MGNGQFPKQLSETGAFQDTARLIPSASLIPYQLNVPFFSDDALKTRWVSIPHGGPDGTTQVMFSAGSEWKFPAGTVFVKHFEMRTDETHLTETRRLETRLLVVDSQGGIQAATYRWRADRRDADLITNAVVEEIPIRTTTGTRIQKWNYPGQQDCRTCHTELNGGVLGPKTRQINGDLAYPSGVTDNQLRTWNHLGLFQPALEEGAWTNLPSLAAAHDLTRGLEERARSYLDANCAHCHRPGGTVGNFDARFETPLLHQNLINGPVLIDQGVDHARVVAPRDIWRSILYFRPSTLEAMKMPPLAHERLDEAGLALLRQWIESLPGPPVLSPPEIRTESKGQTASMEVVLAHPEPGVTIHYTTDGSSPGASDPLYEHPFIVDYPAVVRARAFKPGFTRSIASQQFLQASN